VKKAGVHEKKTQVICRKSIASSTRLHGKRVLLLQKQ